MAVPVLSETALLQRFRWGDNHFWRTRQWRGWRADPPTRAGRLHHRPKADRVDRTNPAAVAGPRVLPASVDAPGGAAPAAVRRTRLGAVVVEPDAVLLHLLAATLDSRFGLEVLAAVGSAETFAAACVRRCPDVVILNPDLPDRCGLHSLPMVVAAHPAVRIVVFTAGATLSRARRHPCLASPIHAIVDKARGFADLSSAVVAVLRSAGNVPACLRAEQRLSGRERDVFVGVGRGLTNAEIGGELGIARQTVETHRKSIAKKLGVSGPGLIRAAVLHATAGDVAAGFSARAARCRD
jgi:DNA-binding NarL/FixJ family response regulator